MFHVGGAELVEESPLLWIMLSAENDGGRVHVGLFEAEECCRRNALHEKYGH